MALVSLSCFVSASKSSGAAAGGDAGCGALVIGAGVFATGGATLGTGVVELDRGAVPGVGCLVAGAPAGPAESAGGDAVVRGGEGGGMLWRAPHAVIPKVVAAIRQIREADNVVTLPSEVWICQGSSKAHSDRRMVPRGESLPRTSNPITGADGSVVRAFTA